ncbi:sodium channel protein Nach [Teleopsis dalmanni]|uniref:sodium channel protein Nach n=1 Tax=Teleopsis dalmanni TaxID=139649 RepID=UPI0018CCECDA|nr:sodium channel protein Nach [Teleopsis dalmanni]
MGHAELEPEDIDESIGPLHSAIKRTWTNLCETTSIHGLKYTRDDETNNIVRFIWILIIIIMFICAITMVCTFYIDYRSNPTRMNVENDHAPISNLLFPAVTVCPEVLFSGQRSTNYVQTLKLPTNVTVQRVTELLRINYGFINNNEQFPMSDALILENVLELNNLTVTKFIENLRWRCSDLLFRCRLYWTVMDCSTLFQIARTFYGHCCSFNIKQEGVNFTNKYSLPGQRDGLSIILYYNDTDYDQITSYSLGFKLLIHDPDHFPSAHDTAKFVGLNEEVFATITPVETFSSSAVKSLAIEERQCVLPHEVPMKYFKSYVGAHCELNCRVMNMVKFCGCYAYFFEIKGVKDRICSYKDVPCLTEKFTDIFGRFRNTQCTCPNVCERIDYDTDLDSADLDLNVPTVDTFYDDIQKDYAVAHIFFNSQVYRRVRHDLLSNMVTLVSNLGSAFSLFVGMSMVSAVEIIYYFTVILQKNYLQEIKARDKLLFRKSAKLKILTREQETSKKL